MTTIDRRQLIRGATASVVAATLSNQALATPTADALVARDGAHRHGRDVSRGRSKRLGEAQPLDDRPLPEFDFTRANRSLGSLVTQNFAIAFPEYFAAVASTSFTAAPDSSGNVGIDGVDYPASGTSIPTYHVYGYGDLPFISGGLWDDTENRLDKWANYHLGVNSLSLSDVDHLDGAFSGWQDRFQTWTWHYPDSEIPVVKLTRNNYRSHNNMPEEGPLMWDFLKHYSHEVDGAGNVARHYSKSGFRRAGDAIRL